MGEREDKELKKKNRQYKKGRCRNENWAKKGGAAGGVKVKNGQKKGNFIFPFGTKKPI